MKTRVVLVAGAALAAAALLVWWTTREDGNGGARVETGAGPVEASDVAPAAPETQPGPGTIRPRRFDAADEPAPAPETAPQASLDPESAYVAGKVIDERRRPAAGVSIEVVSEGRGPLRGKSGGDGRFRIDLGRKPASTSGAAQGPPASGGIGAPASIPRGAVHASDAKGRVAFASFPAPVYSWNPAPAASGKVVDVGTLPLVEAGALTVRVTRDGTGVPGARVYLGTTQSLGFGPFVTDAQGSLGPRRFPEGTHVVTAFTKDLDFRAEARITLPRKDPAPLDVALAPAWRLSVTVKDAATGKGVSGQHLGLWSSIETDDRSTTMFAATLPEPPNLTDADGKTVVSGLSVERSVTVALADPEANSHRRALNEGSRRANAKPGIEEVVITLGEGGETFTFPIVADESNGPPDGAEVRLSVPDDYGGAPPPPKGKVVGTNLVIDGVTKGCINILATAEDGSRAIVRILGDARNTKVGSEARFKKPRTLLVTAHDRKGTPLTGYLAQCRDPGNIMVGPAVPIGADGTARIDGLWPKRLEVTIRRPTEFPFGTKAAGSVDLTKPGDARVDLILDPERPCLLRVTVDGAKRLPATFSVRDGGGGPMSIREVGPIEEDPEEGLLRFGVRPDPKLESLKLTVSGKGCPPVDVTLAIPKDGSLIEGAVALVTGGKILIRVLPPSDNIHDVSLESWYPERSAWSYRGQYRMNQDELGRKPTEILTDALPAARYRARDATTGLFSDALDLAAGGSAEITLDLSRAGPITGRVEGPVEGQIDSAGNRAARQPASVLIEGAGISQPGSARELMMGGPGGGGVVARINSDFKARVPGDRPVTLRVTHPLFSPDPELGTATVTAPGSTVVLKLVKGGEAAFRVAGEGPMEGSLARPSRVFFYAGRPEGEPLLTRNVSWDESVARIGGFKAGKYTLWIDHQKKAPLVLTDVELGDGRTDLGELTFPEGATLRVKVVTRDEQEAAGVNISVSPIAKPEYWRSGSSRGKNELLITGLGAGRFKVEVRGGNFRDAPTTYEIESTGKGEIPLTHEVK